MDKREDARVETPQSEPLNPVDPAIERRVVRKMDLRVLPLVSSLCKNTSTPLFALGGLLAKKADKL